MLSLSLSAASTKFFPQMGLEYHKVTARNPSESQVHDRKYFKEGCSDSPKLNKGQAAAEEKGTFSPAQGIWKDIVTVFDLQLIINLSSLSFQCSNH